MIRLKDLPDDFFTNPGQFDHAATSDAVAALAKTITDVDGIVQITLRNTYYNGEPADGVDCTKIIFTKGQYRHILNVPEFMERRNSYYEFRREFLRILGQLK